MNAPFIWILLPGVVSGLLYFLRRWQRSMQTAGILVSLSLAWLAWKVPIGETIPISQFRFFPSLTLTDTFTVLGRRFIVDNSTRPVLIFIYLGIALWFGGAFIARTDRLFVPLGLGIAALLTAALAVEPFLYAALLIELAVLVSIPMLSPPGKPVGRGVLRYLIFQTLGTPFILFTGWQLSVVQVNPSNPAMVLRISILLILGFAFLAAIFPFHTWIPMLSEEAHPYAAAFVFFVLPGMITLFGMEFLFRYSWLRSLPLVYPVLRFLGLIMVVTGGLWAAFQHHLGRIMGYAVIVEIGLSLLTLSLGFGAGTSLSANSPPLMLSLFFALLLPRGIALAIWALALSILKARVEKLDFRSVFGLGRQLPVVMATLILANFSIAGFPLLASFPVQIALFSALAEQSLPAILLSLLGIAGLMAGGLRSLAVLATGSSQEGWQICESRAQLILLGGGWAMILLLGLLPQWFLPTLTRVAAVFGNPLP